MQSIFKIARDDLISCPSNKCPAFFVISNVLISIPILINVFFYYSKLLPPPNYNSDNQEID